jgi:hypothetical protein
MTTTTVNDALVQFDNLLNAANYLLEELETRKNQIASQENILEKVKEEMDTNSFRNRIVNYIQHEYGEGLNREVAFTVMRKIDSDIEAFINDRVDKALERAGVAVQR